MKMKCTVIKQVHCSDCTEDEANETPYDFSDDEMEVDQVDWEVLEITEDK